MSFHLIFVAQWTYIHILIAVHVNAELEENLGMIEVITHYLIVQRSTLMSLKFLKSLKVIRGDKLYRERSVLTIFTMHTS